MENRTPSDLSLPYGKIALWGLAASVLLSGAVLLASPLSPVRLAAGFVEAGPGTRAVLPLEGARLPSPAEMGRRAVADVLGQHAPRVVIGSRGAGAVRIAPELEAELTREWVRLAPEIRAELSREWARLVPELTTELAREWTRLPAELRAEMRRELRGLHLRIEAAPAGFVVDGG